MIKGIGTDLCDSSRIASVVARYPERFVSRVLSVNEQARFRQHPNPVAFLAKRFAAKEAVSKALGLGIGRIAFTDIEVSNNAKGAPQVTLQGEAQKVLCELGASAVHLSLSDERQYALAFVVLE